MKQVAVVGTGNWGKNLVRTFNQLGVLWGFADSDKKNLARQKALYPNAFACESLEEIISANKVDAVAIATPAPSHYAASKTALLAGLHVFVEKPLTLDVEEANELIQLAKQKNLVLMVGHLMLYHPGIVRIKKMIQAGELGDLLYIYGQRVNLGQVRRDENAMWSLGPHDVSIVNYLFDSSPIRVSAVGSCYIQPEAGIEDVVFLNMMFENKLMANIHLSWLDPHKIRRMTIIGKKKMLVFDDTAPNDKIKLYDKGVNGPFNSDDPKANDATITLRAGDTLIPKIEMGEPLKLELQHFLDCIQNGTKPLSDGQNGLEVLKVLDAAQKSLKSGGQVVEL